LPGLVCVLFFQFQNINRTVLPPYEQKNSVKADFGNLFKNRAWVILAIVGIVSFIKFAMQNAAIAYYFKYYLGREDNVQLFNVLGTVALIVALPLSKPLAKRFGNKNVFIGSSLFPVCSLCSFICRCHRPDNYLYL
jgi:GPH family glycoside/pentoside/hexuronide:cation symporter